MASVLKGNNSIITGNTTFTVRPMFGNNVPWDSGNYDPLGIGNLVLTTGNVAPLSTVKLNGTLLSRTTYAAFWSWVQTNAYLVTETAWGAGATAAYSSGDGSTNFRIPDFRGEFIRFWDDSRTLDTGRGIGTVQGQNMPTHNHQMPMGFDPSSAYYWGNGDNNPIFGSDVIANAAGGSGGLNFATRNIRVAYTNTTLSNQSGELRPRNVSVLACVRYR